MAGWAEGTEEFIMLHSPLDMDWCYIATWEQDTPSERETPKKFHFKIVMGFPERLSPNGTLTARAAVLLQASLPDL